MTCFTFLEQSFTDFQDIYFLNRIILNKQVKSVAIATPLGLVTIDVYATATDCSRSGGRGIDPQLKNVITFFLKCRIKMRKKNG